MTVLPVPVCRDEQIAVMSLAPRKLDQLEQAILKRERAQLERTQDDPRAGLGRAPHVLARRRTRSGVWDEVTALPVAVEHRTELGEHAGLRAAETRTFHSRPVT